MSFPNPTNSSQDQNLLLPMEDPLEEGTATHSSILAGEIPWTEKPGRLQSTGLQRVRHHKRDLAHMQSWFTAY